MEDFDDRNGDNLYTNGVDGFDLNRQDLGDAYVDANKDGVYGDGSTAAPTNPTINGDTDIPIPYQRNNLITVKGDGVRGTAHIRASTVIYLSQASSAGDPTVVVPLSSLSRSYSLRAFRPVEAELPEGHAGAAGDGLRDARRRHRQSDGGRHLAGRRRCLEQHQPGGVPAIERACHWHTRAVAWDGSAEYRKGSDMDPRR